MTRARCLKQVQLPGIAPGEVETKTVECPASQFTSRVAELQADGWHLWAWDVIPKGGYRIHCQRKAQP